MTGSASVSVTRTRHASARLIGTSEYFSINLPISAHCFAAVLCWQVRRRPTEHGGEAVRRDWVRRVLREGGRTPIERLHTWTKVEEIRRLGSQPIRGDCRGC